MIENKKATQIGDNEPKLPSESGFLFSLLQICFAVPHKRGKFQQKNPFAPSLLDNTDDISAWLNRIITERREEQNTFLQVLSFFFDKFEKIGGFSM